MLGTTVDFPLPELCGMKAWPRLPGSFRAAVTGNQQILMVSGTLDGRTPPSNATDIARKLPNGKTLVLDGVSHDLFGDARAMDAVVRYLRSQQTP